MLPFSVTYNLSLVRLEVFDNTHLKNIAECELPVAINVTAPAKVAPFKSQDIIDKAWSIGSPLPPIVRDATRDFKTKV